MRDKSLEIVEDELNRPITFVGTAPASASTLANRPARASFRLAWGNTRIEAKAQITPIGLFAIGAMVGTILLAVVPIVKAGARVRSRR